MSKRILIVDDEEIVAEISKRKLEQSGYDSITAVNGKEALEEVQRQLPDLIVLDIEMPEMNGYTFISHLRKLPDGDKVPVIVITAYEEMRPIMQRHSLKAYLKKPLQLSELLDKIKEVLGD